MIYSVDSKYRKYINDEMYLNDFNEHLKNEVTKLIGSRGEDLFKFGKILSLLKEDQIRFIYLVIENCSSGVQMELIQHYLFETRGGNNSSMFTNLKTYNKGMMKEYELKRGNKEYINFLRGFMEKRNISQEDIDYIILYLYHINLTDDFQVNWLEFRNENIHLINPSNEKLHVAYVLGYLDLDNGIDVLDAVTNFAVRNNYYGALDNILKLKIPSNRHRDVGRLEKCHNTSKEGFNLSIRLAKSDVISDKELIELCEGDNYSQVYNVISILNDQNERKVYNHVLFLCTALGKIDNTINNFKDNTKDIVMRQLEEYREEENQTEVSKQLEAKTYTAKRPKEELNSIMDGLDKLSEVIGEEKRLEWGRYINKNGLVNLNDVIEDVNHKLKEITIEEILNFSHSSNMIAGSIDTDKNQSYDSIEIKSLSF